MSTKYLDLKVVPLTHELAVEFATMDASIGERPIRKLRYEFLKSRVESNQFYPPRWAVAWIGGRKVRVNGQHSSKVLADANGHFPKNLKVIIDEFQCDDTDDLSELFSQFDNKVSSRSNTDIVGAHSKTVKSIADIKTSYISRMLDGMSYHLTGGFAESRPTIEERARLVHTYDSYIKNFWDFTKARWVGGRVGIHGAMFATYSASNSEAFTFWNLVMSESHPDADHPSRTLAKWLQESHHKKENWTARAVYSKCVHAWNAFRGGTTTHLRYYENAPLPVAA